MKITLLGTGPSTGVPVIGCLCAVCSSNKIYNQRTRASIFVESKMGVKILLDTGPDLRAQMLANALPAPDVIFYTHEHADHAHGIDDVRAFNMLKQAAIPAFMNAQTRENLQLRFPYVFVSPKAGSFQWSKATISPFELTEMMPFCIDDCYIVPIAQMHGPSTTLGFRINDFAYSTDVNFLSEESLSTLKNLDLWIVGCLRYAESATHANLEQVLNWISEIKPKRTILTHMAHELDFDALQKQLPASAEVGYDGMVVLI
jgi:phosphoribosyl 1,2-cyclic phosphate phosphodiesterase